MTPFSVLDLCPIPAGSDAAEALRRSLELARHAERLGFRRFWLAEHHNMPGIASAATPIVIGYVAGGTSTIRVGAGGIMLPNHSPLVVAEQFGTLASLHPGRIDLGLGRAPGTDPLTAQALRRDAVGAAESFPRDVQELQAYFAPAREGQKIRAVPGAGLDVPIWLLGSSLFSAQLAAALGLPFAFASHFAPDELERALDRYRRLYTTAGPADRPYAMVAANVVVADTDAEARRQFTSPQQSFVHLRRGQPGPVPPPIDDIESFWSPIEKAGVEHALTHSFVGAPDTVERGLRGFLARTRADEVMVTAHLADQAARLRSLELLAEIVPRLGARRVVAAPP